MAVNTLNKMFALSELKGMALSSRNRVTLDKENLKKIFRNLNAKKIPYLTIGGIAALLYDVETITFSIDLLLPSDLEILQNLISIFKKLNYKEVYNTDTDKFLMSIGEISPKDIMEETSVRFVNGYRVDILTVPKKQFYMYYERRREIEYEDTVVALVHINDLITLLKKRCTEKDLLIVKKLEKVKKG